MAALPEAAQPFLPVCVASGTRLGYRACPSRVIARPHSRVYRQAHPVASKMAVPSHLAHQCLTYRKRNHIRRSEGNKVGSPPASPSPITQPQSQPCLSTSAKRPHRTTAARKNRQKTPPGETHLVLDGLVAANGRHILRHDGQRIKRFPVRCFRVFRSGSGDRVAAFDVRGGVRKREIFAVESIRPPLCRVSQAVGELRVYSLSRVRDAFNFSDEV